MDSPYDVLIREAHLDTLGHVNNAVYLQLFEEARWELISNRGFDLKYIQSSGLGPVILDIHIVYKQELTLRQRISIRTQLLSYEGKVGKMKQSMVDQQGTTYCEALFTFALFDTRLRKIIPPTPEWLHAIGKEINS